MLWFLFSLVCLGISFFAENSRNLNSKKRLMVILAMVMSMMTGLSGQVSIDHLNYVDIYANITSLAYFTDYSVLQLLIGGGFVEPGYALINIFCNKLSLGTVGFFVVVAFITNLLAVFVIFKFPKPTIGIILFIVSTHFYYQTNLVRQMIAVSGFMFCFTYLYEKRYLAYAISVVILTSFHSSALLLLSLCGLKFLDSDRGESIIKYGLLSLWLISLYVLFTGSQLGGLAEIINTIFGGTVYERYTSGDKQLNAGYGIAYIYNLFTAISFYVYTFNKNWNKDKFLYIVIFQLGCILVNIASSIETLSRFALYFSCFQFLVLPYMTIPHILGGKKSWEAMLGKMIYVFLMLYYGLYILGYSFIIEGGTLLGKEMYSITSFFN